jgi:mRNA interferase HigB
MRVISTSALIALTARHPAAGMPLQVWRRIIESRTFAGFADIRKTFNSVDRVEKFYVFDIDSNKYRIVAALHFNKQRLFVRHVFTHKEYDSWTP